MIKNISLSLFSLIVMGLLNSISAQTKKYNWDAIHANINFAVNYLKFSETTGRFTKSSGSFEYSKPDFSDAKVVVEADVNSVNTDNEQRDGHLKAPDFFDAAKYPSIKFVSTSFKKVKGVNYKINGQLTMKGITKNVTADAIYLGENTDAYGQTHSMWKVTFKVNRQDYGVSFTKNNAVGDAVVGDEVRLSINAQFILVK
jgi:polyisoprenoid-binding protein YceI